MGWLLRRYLRLLLMNGEEYEEVDEAKESLLDRAYDSLVQVLATVTLWKKARK